MRHTSGIGVIDKTVCLLRATAAKPLTLAELSASTGIPRATAHRLAVALEVHGLLTRDNDGRFLPGSLLTELAAGLPDPLLTHAPEVLRRLRDSCGESAQLYRRDGFERVCVAAAERHSGLRTTVPIGTRMPLTAGSGAQILCAWEPPESLPQLLAGAQFTAKLLADVRRRGWSQSVGEREAGVASVSAPVFDALGNVIAAISISGPIERLGRSPGTRCGQVLVSAGQRLTAILAGWQPTAERSTRAQASKLPGPVSHD